MASIYVKRAGFHYEAIGLSAHFWFSVSAAARASGRFATRLCYKVVLYLIMTKFSQKEERYIFNVNVNEGLSQVLYDRGATCAIG